MKHQALILHLIGLLASSASAQTDSTRAGTAEAYFNQASRQYVKEDKGSAMRLLDRGLRAHPGDARLLALARELLKEENQQNQQQQQQQQNQQQQQQEQEQSEKGQQQEQTRPNERTEAPEKEGMSKQDAERVLDELDRNEQNVQEKARARRMPARKRNPEKDW